MASSYVGLPALLARLEAAGMMATNQGANHLVGEAADAAPNRTGELAGGIHTEGARLTGSGCEAVVQTGAESSDYAEAQEGGAGPHIIRAKNAKALHFNGTFAKQVNHPGNPAVHYMENSLLGFKAEFIAGARAAMKAAF